MNAEPGAALMLSATEIVMKTILTALAATALVGSAALAQGYPAPGHGAPGYPLRVRADTAPVPYGLSDDEARDYAREQLDRRHEMERDQLRINQKIERRRLGLDD